jgi:serine/tyrosine/threonine adenylyltransferase
LSTSKADPKDSVGWRFDNSYARLPAALFTRVRPVPVREPGLVVFNDRLSSELGLVAGALRERGAGFFSGNTIPEGADPIAQAYAGHQFGHFTNLGDGRAILLGEQITPDGLRFDIQLKGSGQTPYSRRGDGRAALGPMIREYIISEAMHALGIPTTRSLAVITTGEDVIREEALPGAILTRIAASHLRVGTFEYAAALQEHALLEALTKYTLQRHYPELLHHENSALALLGGVMERQASLIARWMGVGFVHGVMNTDNMALSGETIDYGPCAFLDIYDPDTVFSSIDRGGRYAFANQPDIAHWNLARLAESLLPLIDANQEKAVSAAMEVLGKFSERFRGHHAKVLRAKFGLITQEDGDHVLATEFLELMTIAKADFTSTFAALTKAVERDDARACRRIGALASLGGGFMEWHSRWRDRLDRQQESAQEVLSAMRGANPVVIPRNHRVEEALDATAFGDLSVLHRLLEVLANPFEETSENEPYREASPTVDVPYRTFCGT